MQDTEESPPDEVPRADESEDAPTGRRPFVAADCQIFAYVEAGRIKATDAFLYLVLLKHYNPKRVDKSVWPSRSALAKAIGLKRVDSVDVHLARLRDAGLISWTERRIGKMKASNRYELHLIADTKRAEEVPLKTAHRYPVQRGLDTPWTEDELEQEELPQDELDPNKFLSSAASPSFASLSTATASQNSSNFEDPWAEYDRKPRDDKGATEDYRKTDRELFRVLVGKRLRTNGDRWGKDGQVYTADAFYNAYRTQKRGKLRWPGRLLQHLTDSGRDVEDWLIDQGLETVND